MKSWKPWWNNSQLIYRKVKVKVKAVPVLNQLHALEMHGDSGGTAQHS